MELTSPCVGTVLTSGSIQGDDDTSAQRKHFVDHPPMRHGVQMLLCRLHNHRFLESFGLALRGNGSNFWKHPRRWWHIWDCSKKTFCGSSPNATWSANAIMQTPQSQTPWIFWTLTNSWSANSPSECKQAGDWWRGGVCHHICCHKQQLPVQKSWMSLNGCLQQMNLEGLMKAIMFRKQVALYGGAGLSADSGKVYVFICKPLSLWPHTQAF